MEPEVRQEELTKEMATGPDIQDRRFGLSSSALKMFAVVTMLIDHVAAVLLVKLLIHNGTWEFIEYNGSRMLNILSAEHMDMINLYQLMRNIGRIAFPIYCFMLVEGFMRTRNIQKYLSRILVFALVSEIPFDLAFAGKVFYWDYQNVMFTLFWGLIAMYVSHTVELKTDKWFIKWPITTGTWLIAAWAAEWMLTDYGAKGVGCICVLYLLRYVPSLQLLCGAAVFTWELPAPIAFLFIALYNGKKGLGLKHFFYAFYPVHLMLLYIISVVLGMGSIVVI